MSIKKMILLLLMILFLLLSCSGRKDKPGNTNGKEVVKKKEFDLLVKEVKIKESDVYKGLLLTSSPGDKCFYVEEPAEKKDNTIPLKIINKENGKILKKVVLNKEDFFSKVNFDNPSPLYYPPSYISNLNDRYYIVGRFSKINTFDSDFKLLYSSTFQKPRYFIAFYKEDGKIKFAVGGKKDPKEKWKISISLYTLFKYRKIKKNKKIFEIFIPNVLRSYYGEGNIEKTFPGSNILPSLSGFIKGVAPPTHMGKLYYSIGTENKIYIYHLDTGETKVFQLNYLKGKKYTSEDVKKIKKFKLPPGLKKYGEIAPEPFSGKIFHLGLLDVGEDKIGIIGELETGRMVFRLDIFNAATLDYIESILLPCGTSFLQSLERGPALFHIFIDYDKKTYIWGDWEGEKPDFLVKYSRFER